MEVAGGTADISGGTISGTYHGVEVGFTNVGGTVNISGNVTITSALVGAGVFVGQYGKATISGGTITSTNSNGMGLEAVNGSNVTLTGGTFTGGQYGYSVCRDSAPATVAELLADGYWYYDSTGTAVPESHVQSGTLAATAGYGTVTVKLLPIPVADVYKRQEIRSAVLMIHGEKAHSCYFSKDAFSDMMRDNAYTDNKELMLIPGAVHTDLYDGGEKSAIPFDKMERFFEANLK